jgi:hypothetical protein
MSQYRPWDPPKGATPDATDERQQTSKPDTKPPATKAFEAPPGMTGGPEKRAAKTPDVAGGMLLSTGGLFVIAALVCAIVFGGLQSLAQQGGDSVDAETFGNVQGALGWPLFLVGSLSGAAGFGILYEQKWAKGLGIGMAILGLMTIVCTIPSIIALSTIGRPYR